MNAQNELFLGQSIGLDAILSVGQYTRHLKKLLEGEVPPMWIRGEVSNLKVQSSGHVYFTLKDAESQIPAVMFKGVASKQSLRLTDGIRLLVYGEINLYEPRGAYQLIARCLLEDGIGRLQIELEKLKQKLAAEGLFDKERKKSLPKIAKKVGIITSPTGAAIQDFIALLERHEWKGEVLLFPAKVQGTGAIASLVEQIKKADAYPELDLLVISRGGGSLEDLWAFNEEIVLRAIAACHRPTLSAVGHEIDFMLSDLVADLRAETPSAAAMWLIQNQRQITDQYTDTKEKWKVQLNNALKDKLHDFHLTKEAFRALSPKHRLENAFLRLDEARSTLEHAVEKQWSNLQTQLTNVKKSFHIHQLEKVFYFKKALFEQTKPNLKKITQSKWTDVNRALITAKERLAKASLPNILQRGFVYLTTASGHVITESKEIKPNEAVEAHLADGNIWMTKKNLIFTSYVTLKLEHQRLEADQGETWGLLQ